MLHLKDVPPVVPGPAESDSSIFVESNLKTQNLTPVIVSYR